MKSNYILIALAMLAALTMVSCGNNKKAQSQEPTQEEVQEMKQALADSVLAEIDAFVEQFFDASSKSFTFKTLELTDAEKLIKPDYLLDPSIANTLITKSQKINAVAIYLSDLLIRNLYDMPQEETKAAIAKLAADVNHPIDSEFMVGNAPGSEKIKREYEICKERGEIAYFWQFQNAILCETNYILANNPELFFSKISEENLMAYNQKWASLKSAIRKLSEYDEQMNTIKDTIFANPNNETSDEELKDAYFKDIKTAIETYKFNKLNQIEKRNALLQ